MKQSVKLEAETAQSASPASDFTLDIRVLVIDDDKYMRSVIGRMLNTLGVEYYSEAADGIQGIRAIQSSEQVYDLTILDIDMPNSDGMDFLRFLAERRYTNPIMILSGKPADLLTSVQAMAKEYGLNLLRVAHKPPSVALLREALASCRSPVRSHRSFGESIYSQQEILAGLAKKEFEAFFQPKVEISTRRVRGCEVLGRWRHPRDGIVGPDTFIQVLEDMKRIDELTWAMLEQAASWCRRWHDAGLAFTVSVNLSVSSLSDRNIADHIYEIVRSAGVEAADITLEITETAAMTEVPQCLESLCRLRLKGFGLSIDDFGTGFSSLQQLTRVPYTELKIDRLIVNGAATSAQGRSVLESCIDIAKKLGLTSVAEGVEAEEDLKLLEELGCQLAQGYFIAKPLSGEEFTAWAFSNDRSSLSYAAERFKERERRFENAPHTSRAEVSSRSGGPRILIVEDESLQRHVLASVLKSSKRFGSIIEADSCAAAIALLESERVDLIISDIAMPGLNGLELLRQIRAGQTSARHDTAFLLLTSYSNTEVLSVAMALDANGFVVKPFTTGVVLDKITRILAEKLPLRPEARYDSVVTDIPSLRSGRSSAHA